MLGPLSESRKLAGTQVSSDHLTAQRALGIMLVDFSEKSMERSLWSLFNRSAYRSPLA